MNRKKGATKPDEQGRAFIAKARELGCDDDPEAFERVFARVVPPKRRTEMPAGQKSGARARRSRTARKGV